MLGFDLDAMAYMSVGLGAKLVRSRGFDGVLGGLHSWCHLTTGQIRRMPSKRYGGAAPARLASATLSASTAWWWRGILLVGVLGILTIGIATLRGSTVKIGLLLAEATLHSLAELLGIRHLAMRGIAASPAAASASGPRVVAVEWRLVRALPWRAGRCAASAATDPVT